MKNIIISFIDYLNELRKPDELKYLENSIDAVDLEYRQKRIANGTAPFQQQYYNHTKSYISDNRY